LTEYTINGLIKLQQTYFQQIQAAGEIAKQQELSRQVLDYLNQLKKQLKEKQLSEANLTLKCRAALFNLEGLACYILERPHRYAELFRQIAIEKESFKKIRKKKLILSFSASQRLSHRISLKSDLLTLSVSYASLDLPDDYILTLANVLFSKISGMPVSPRQNQKLLELENKFQQNSAIANSGTYRRKIQDDRNHRLEKIFERLNDGYFEGSLERPNLRWSARRNYRRLGSYDAKRHRLTISRIFDHPDIPELVVENIVYHEMLHIVHPIKQNNGRRIIHGSDFKKDEKHFSHYREAKEWLKSEFPKFLRNRK